MLKASEKSIQYVRDNFENAEELLNGDLNGLLDVLGAKSVYELGVDSEPTAESRAAERALDDFYYSND